LTATPDGASTFGGWTGDADCDGQVTMTGPVSCTATFTASGGGGFIAYNDLAWGTGQLDTKITKITSPAGNSGLPSVGLLKDFNTGLNTGVTLTVTGGEFTPPGNATQGLDPTTTGSDAFTLFNGKVSGLGVISYITGQNDSLELTFTGLNSSKIYDLAFFAHRNNYAWDRASLVAISGQDAFTNTSSVATDNPIGGVIFSGPTDESTRLPADNDSGYVARFSDINPGSDGTVVLTISFDGTSPVEKGKYGSAIMVVEQ
jgi:hypothetical protein